MSYLRRRLRLWPLQKWRRDDLTGFWMIHHSPTLGFFRRCKCWGCQERRAGNAQRVVDQ